MSKNILPMASQWKKVLLVFKGTILLMTYRPPTKPVLNAELLPNSVTWEPSLYYKDGEEQW